MLAQHLATLKIRTPGGGQGIYLREHRLRGHAREIVLHVGGEKRA